MKAFLGMGLLGSNFVKAMLQKGEAVHVWNRTAAKATALEAYGAKAFEQVEDAVKDADIIHVTTMSSAGMQEVAADANRISTGGAPTILIGSEG